MSSDAGVGGAPPTSHQQRFQSQRVGAGKDEKRQYILVDVVGREDMMQEVEDVLSVKGLDLPSFDVDEFISASDTTTMSSVSTTTQPATLSITTRSVGQNSSTASDLPLSSSAPSRAAGSTASGLPLRSSAPSRAAGSTTAASVESDEIDSTTAEMVTVTDQYGSVVTDKKGHPVKVAAPPTTQSYRSHISVSGAQSTTTSSLRKRSTTPTSRPPVLEDYTLVLQVPESVVASSSSFLADLVRALNLFAAHFWPTSEVKFVSYKNSKGLVLSNVESGYIATEPGRSGTDQAVVTLRLSVPDIFGEQLISFLDHLHSRYSFGGELAQFDMDHAQQLSGVSLIALCEGDDSCSFNGMVKYDAVLRKSAASSVAWATLAMAISVAACL